MTENRAFVRWLQAADSVLPELADPDLARVAPVVAPLRGADRVNACDVELCKLNGRGPEVWEQLRRIMAEMDTPQTPPINLNPCVPELPEHARLDPGLAFGAGGWIDTYADYAGAISPMTPRTFHESAALWLGSAAIARRLKLPMAFGDVYPNLFVCWIAVTTLYRKSTALDVARHTARRVFPHLMAAQDTTPEAFLSDLAGREPTNMDEMTDVDRAEWQAGRNYSAQRGWLLDEMSGLMAASGRDYNAGLVESLLRFYDCDSFYVRSTRGQGRIVVRNSYLSLLSASTPAAMSAHLTAERLWSMGWWPRFAILTPESTRPDWHEARECARPDKLDVGLRNLYSNLPAAIWPEPPAAQTVTLAGEAFAAWGRYNKAVSHDLLTDDLDVLLYGAYGRMPTHALKVSTIMAALDWAGEGPVTIELKHMARALLICEEWRASAHRVLATVTENVFGQMEKRILYQIGRFAPDGPSFRDLYRAMSDKTPTEINDTLQQMIDMGEIIQVEVKPPGRGRSADRYQIPTD